MTQDKRKALYLVGLKPNNVKEKYTRWFNRWRFQHSDEIWEDGELISVGQKELMLLGGPKESESDYVISDTKDGFELTESQFIEEQLKEHEPIIEATMGSSKNRTVHNRAKLYVGFLNSRLGEIDKPSDLKNSITFKDIFIKESEIQSCVDILKAVKLNGKPFLSKNGSYIGGCKGIFPLWIECLRDAKPPFIHTRNDIEYSKAIRNEIPNSITPSMTEFRTDYVKIRKNKQELVGDINTLLSALRTK